MMQPQNISNPMRVALAAAAVAAVVVAVVTVVDPGTPAPERFGASPGPQSTSTTAAAQADAAAAVELFAPATTEDVAQESRVDVEASWPVGGCPLTEAPGADRVAFVVGSERGPEYVQERAIGWYADLAAAEAAYRAVEQAVRSCGSTEEQVETAPAPLGTEGVIAIVAGPASGGVVEVSSYAISWSAGAVVLASDHSTFHAGSIPAPGEASTTVAAAQRLLDEVCRVDASRC